MLQVLEDISTCNDNRLAFNRASLLFILYVYGTYLMCTFSTCKLDKYFHVSV